MPGRISGGRHPARNALSAALSSLAAQKCGARIAVVIIDDGSPCGAVHDLYTQFRKNAGGFEWGYIRRDKPAGEAKGPSCALNTAVNLLFGRSRDDVEFAEIPSAATAFSFFCYMHGDDILPENSVAARVSRFYSRVEENLGAVYGNLRVISGRGVRDISYRDFHSMTLLRYYMYLADYFPDHTMMWRREFLEAAANLAHSEHSRHGPMELFDPNLCYMEDTDASMTSALTAYLTGASIGHVNHIVYEYNDAGEPGSISSGEFTPGAEAFEKRVYAQNLIPDKHFAGSLPKLVREVMRLMKVNNIKIESFMGHHLFAAADRLASMWSRKQHTRETMADA